MVLAQVGKPAVRAWVICLDSRGRIHSSAADGERYFGVLFP